ncbi:hypothetical protein JCM10908_000918 [Rhodotorula pacifica]|uniref:uncharacterized protein n=1 Tax=Rhodotorula pacifica TaxID=1495444 RepID=UPI003176874E
MPLDRIPVEIGQKILVEDGGAPWDVKDTVNSACCVSREWRRRFQPLRVPHLEHSLSLALARQQPQELRDRATTILVGTPTEREKDVTLHPTIPADDFEPFLALHPNARHAVLVNLTKDTLIENSTFGGEPVPIIYLQMGKGRGLRDYLTLCAVNVALRVHDLAPTDVYALRHLRIELVADESSVAGLQALLTTEHLPHLQTLQLGFRRPVPDPLTARFPAPTVNFLDKLTVIQLAYPFPYFPPDLIPISYLQTSTPVLYTIVGLPPPSFPAQTIPHLKYMQIDQKATEIPSELFGLLSLLNLKAVFVPHNWDMYVSPEDEDHARDILADFARRKVEFVYGQPQADWTIIDPTFETYLRRRNPPV